MFLNLNQMIQPLNNNVLCEIINEERKSVLIMVEKEKRMEKGKVLAISKDVEIVKKGDILYFKSYSLSPVEVDGKELYFIKAEDILAKV